MYICREFFSVEDTGHRNAMHGFWMAMARLASQQWWRPGWWPYWDAGMPFEYTYAPLVPGLTALWSKIAGVSDRQSISFRGRLHLCTYASLAVCDGSSCLQASWLELCSRVGLFPARAHAALHSR